jgi:pSer/pThr/pTyr-binding forkhead associated (FHA) protein
VKLNGELILEHGGDPIPLIRSTVVIGRRESCDICLRLPNVSGIHCKLDFKEGYWRIRDLDSTNGIKVNGVRVTETVLYLGDTISIAKRFYTIKYTPPVSSVSFDPPPAAP